MKLVLSLVNKPELILWLLENKDLFPQYIRIDDNGNPKLRMSKLRLRETGDNSVTLLQVNDDELAAIQQSPSEILAVAEKGASPNPYEIVEADPILLAKYETAYDRTPIPLYDNGIGEEPVITGYTTPSINIGLFA